MVSQQWSGFRRPFAGNPQQGSLFDVRDVPSEPVDSPGMRKRTRREEMLAAMPSTKIFSSDPRHDEVRQKIVERGAVAERYPGNPQVAEGNTATDHAGKGRRAEIARDLADNTTVPPSDLQGLAQISEGQYAYGEVEGKPHLQPEFAERSAAHYDRTRHANGPVIAAPAKMSTHTVAHELGHHVSANSPGYDERRGLEAVGPVTDRQLPREEAFADDYAVRHGQPPGYEAGAVFDAEKQPWRTSDFSREYLAARTSPLQSQEFDAGDEQLAAFETEEAIAPDADAEVQAFTRDEGREVIGWSPNPGSFGDRQAVFKHAYDERHETPFYGANYVTMFNDDVVPERRLDDWQTQSFRHTDPVVKQTWKQR